MNQSFKNLRESFPVVASKNAGDTSAAFGLSAQGVETSAGSYQPGQAGSPHAIDKSHFLAVVSKSFEKGRIDLYQAVMLLETNCNKPAVQGVDHPLRLIDLHNNDLDFSHKAGELLRSLFQWGYSYDEIRASGILRKKDTPGHKDEHYTVADIHEENGIQLAQPEALHTNGEAKYEVVEFNKLSPDVRQKSYSAIPKAIFLKLVTDAMNNERMNYMQAMMMFSINCHSLEIRKNSGRRYLDHPMAVAAGAELTQDQRILALIHDVIENSNITLEDLRLAGIPQRMLDSIDAVTIRADEKEDYEELELDQLYEFADVDPRAVKGYYNFIERCSKDADALAVKCADIRHNMLDASESKKNRYRVALGYLAAVQAKEIEAGSSLQDWAEQHMPAEYNLAMDSKKQKLLRCIDVKEETLRQAHQNTVGKLPEVFDLTGASLSFKQSAFYSGMALRKKPDSSSDDLPVTEPQPV